MRPNLVLVCGLLIVSLAAVIAAEPTLAVARIAQPPKLDGVLDDACWGEARWQSGMRLHADPTKPAPHDTRFVFLCDDRFLYVGAEMAEPSPKSLVAKGTKHDAKIYRDDCIQVFVDPIRTDDDYFAFSVNSLGTVRDTKKLTAAWNTDTEASAHISDQAWSLEVAIPLGDLELAPEAASKPWGVNVTRVRRAGAAAQLSTFALIRGTFHEPALFVPLMFPRDVLAPYLWSISEPSERAVKLVSGKPVAQAKVQIQNLTGRFWFFLASAAVHGEGGGANGETVRDGLDNQDQHFLNVATPTGGLDKGMLVVSLHDALDPSWLLARRQTPVELAYSPLTIRLTVPWYKNAIFATQGIDKVECSVHSDLPADALAAFAMVADIRDGKRTVCGPVRVGKVEGKTGISITATALPVGDYGLHVALVDRTGRTVHKASTRLRKLAPRAGEVRFDRNMACLVDGRPFIPFGWFGVRAEAFDEFAADGYNTVGAYLPTCTSLTDEQVKAYLDEAHRLGLKVICRPQPNLAMVRSAQKLMTKKDMEDMRALVRKWRDHPAVLAWYMCDEPEGKAQPLARRLQEYRIVDDEDPYHPAIVLNNTTDGIRKYHTAGDLLMPDVYPGFLRKGGASRIIRPTNAMVACREATEGRKPVWVTPQGQIQVVEGHRGPTFRELRNQAWQTVAHDATGFFWYREVFLKNLVHSKIGTPYVHGEIAAIGEAVRSKSVSGLVRADAAADRLTLGAKKIDRHIYVIAVSLSIEDMEVAFVVDDLGDRPLLVLSEGRRVVAHQGQFRDKFEPYEAHVYTTDVSLADLPSVAQVEAIIEEGFRARHKPGNLAYQGAGAEVHPQHHGGQALFINDGSIVGVYWPREYGKVSHPLPNWIDIQFPTPQKVGRVLVYSLRRSDRPPTFRSGEVQIAKDEQWVTVATIADSEKDPTTFTFSPQETQRLRLLITRSNGSRIAIQEIEVYGEQE